MNQPLPSSTHSLSAALTNREGGRYDILPAQVYFCLERQAFHDMASDVGKDAAFTARWWDVRHEFPTAPKARRG